MSLAARILCRVVDNFGDAGVAWRLARQLSLDFGWRVTLTIDRPELLARFGADPQAAVRVEPWPGDGRSPVAEDVLIGAFGAEPPPALRAALAGGPRRPIWVNLAYRRAETWLEGCHGLASTKPGDGAIEHFFYPGFTVNSGGLLRERSLLDRRAAFAGSPQQRDFLLDLGVAREPGERLVTLFCYPDAPVGAWFEAIAAGERPHCVLVPEATAETALAAFFGAAPATCAALRRGRLRVQRIPFLSHDDYDRLLWSADLNFVRGEDSWIRAHWAGRPFVWQPYVQAGQAHHVKLQAFLDRFAAGAAVDAMMRAWSGAGALAPAWASFDAALPGLEPAYRGWSARLAGQTDLATRLVEFCADRL